MFTVLITLRFLWKSRSYLIVCLPVRSSGIGHVTSRFIRQTTGWRRSRKMHNNGKLNSYRKRYTDKSGRYEHSTQDRSVVVFDTKKTRESLIHEALHCYGVYVDDVEISRDNVHVCLCVVDVLNAGVIKVFSYSSLSSGRRLSVFFSSCKVLRLWRPTTERDSSIFFVGYNQLSAINYQTINYRQL